MPKYKDSETARNNDEIYKNLFEERGLKQGVVQYRTKTFNVSEKNGQKVARHVWSLGDKLFKLSYEYYSTYEYWWVIALFNGKPTDAHYEFGDTVFIPLDPNSFVRGE